MSSADGSDFVETGMAERVIWGGLLMTGGWVMGRGATRGSIRFRASISIIAAAALHGLLYTLLLHNPLWATQSVGAIPVLNLLILAFGLFRGHFSYQTEAVWLTYGPGQMLIVFSALSAVALLGRSGAD